MGDWQPIETAPRDGRRILCVDLDCADIEASIRICYPKLFPRPLTAGEDVDTLDSKTGDRWEYFRDDASAPGHTWSMVPTHWMPLPDPPPHQFQPMHGSDACWRCDHDMGQHEIV